MVVGGGAGRKPRGNPWKFLDFEVLACPDLKTSI
jgi:hypothetical protein